VRKLNPLQRKVFADSSSAYKTFCHLELSALESLCTSASCHEKPKSREHPDALKAFCPNGQESTYTIEQEYG
jgi:hypothetical protein